jgi:RNA-directed DNA polymerase
MSHTQKWEPICPQLRRVQEKARSNPKERFTSLAHHLNVSALHRSFKRIRANSAPGVDGVDKEEYAKDLFANLEALHERLKSGKYRASPVLRCWIEKPGGGRRPLGLPTVEDKIVQGAVVEILNCIYEEDFRNFSYGFRPGRSPHHALRALQTALQKGRVNWVLDADVSKFFDSIDHKELMAVLERRVVDRSLLRLIGKWLAAGVVEEDGRRVREKRGTPQGGVISPLLANVFLHYVLDEFVHDWRVTKARGEVYIVRYADDFVLAFEREDDALELQAALGERLAEYGLSLNEDKTRLLRFGRRWSFGDGPRPGTFDFLGFTHFSGKSRKGKYVARRKTSRKRYNRSLQAIKQWLKRHMHAPISWQLEQLSKKLVGHYQYYGVRLNFESLSSFRERVFWMWYRSLCRRNRKPNKDRIYQHLTKRFVLPRPKITHPENWLPVDPGYLLGRAGCGNTARPDL